ncbi:exodeoxyribonuclease V subunit gamma [Fodinibius sediminis]|uniref:DNA helicase/exodeoxyribonuclease V, gamma subunit n=1 Tax=Fodinibius sediminis TaxID=1214077 RepID=A0A521AZX8_9BACT|nr:exodeoxyribonuclease V subunit gamma [Fodinibius sediminis]SMO40387.1 DNA helicase/exodeoxyribonuclease V, gamma subunit [Fodinibius sediminis]
MLEFYHSTELEKLADLLFEELGKPSRAHPLDEEIFVVQNNGIGQWLSLRMAEKEGIAANLKFEFPSERIWSLIRLQNETLPEHLPSDRGPMTWTLMELFGDGQFLNKFDNLHHYIQEEDPLQRSMRCWKLASKIADVFDQYLIYRPRMILNWEKDDYQVSSYAEQWQSRLWKTLVKHWTKNYEGQYLHRAQLQEGLWDAIAEGTLPADKLPGRITVFGVSSVSPAFIETMIRLSRLTDVFFYQLSFAPSVTQTGQFRNPLLQSMGRERTSFMSLFTSYIETSEQLIEQMERKESRTSAHGKKSFFQAIQSDIKKDSRLNGRNLQVPPADRSIQVHNCHSPMREVEVLHDQLLALLDENPGLRPDEILVMTPDIETYALVIDAVFGTPDEGQPDIPYVIADRGVGQTNPATKAFLKILELCESRFKVTEVLDLLDSNPIREKFGFTDEELNRLEQWVADNRIRWGVDGYSKNERGLPDSDHFTWKAGLRRILLGYMMQSEKDQLYNKIYAYGEVESSDDAALAGRLSLLLHRMFDLVDKVREPRRPRQWQQLLDEMADRFLPDTREYFWELSKIRESVGRLAEDADLGGYRQRISFSVIRRWLGEHLQEQSTGGGHIGKGVTFSSLMPMRSIPFKLIGMIGMNEGAFPRSKIPIEFDLMYLDPQPGDPVRSEQDRNLFLENILSARHGLYFSYVGQSNRQDTQFPPSVVLREFLDYLEEYYDLYLDDLVTDHPLQSYDAVYFKERGLFSYSQTQHKISRKMMYTEAGAKIFMKNDLPDPDDARRQVSINELVSFFQHPAKFLLQNRLGIFLTDERVVTEDREPFTLSGLDNYQVGQELLDRFFGGESLGGCYPYFQSRDLLPEGWIGEHDFTERVQEVQEFGNNLKSLLDRQKMEDEEVDLAVGDFRIVGRLTGIYKHHHRIDYRFGSMRPKDVIDLWIKHLCLQAVKTSNQGGTSRLFTRHKKKRYAEYQLGSVAGYRQILGELLMTYWRGLQRCCYFFPESAFAYAEQVCYKNGSPDTGLSRARNKWIREYSDYPGEGQDPYNKLLLGDENPLQKKAFKRAAENFWEPFFEAIVGEGG